jgi:hypothetical protein
MPSELRTIKMEITHSVSVTRYDALQFTVLQITRSTVFVHHRHRQTRQTANTKTQVYTEFQPTLHENEIHALLDGNSLNN